jgi:hypothetical protein
MGISSPPSSTKNEPGSTDKNLEERLKAAEAFRKLRAEIQKSYLEEMECHAKKKI